MKKRKIILFAAIFCLGSLCYKSKAQDWHKINPDGVQTLVDTTHLKAVIVTIAPGETIGPLTHPMNFAYFLSNGKVKVYPEGKTPVIMNFEKGEHMYSDYQGPHRTENIGDVPLKFLSVELIKHPYEEE